MADTPSIPEWPTWADGTPILHGQEFRFTAWSPSSLHRKVRSLRFGADGCWVVDDTGDVWMPSLLFMATRRPDPEPDPDVVALRKLADESDLLTADADLLRRVADRLEKIAGADQ
jgi:hypothetical protein